MVHKILTEDPRYRANVEGQARVAEAQGNLAKRLMRVRRERQEARQKYEADYRLAVMRGEDPPAPPPEPPAEPALAMELTGTMNRLIEEQAGLMNTLAPEIERKAIVREREILDEVLETPAGELGELVEEVRSLAYTVHACLHTDERADLTAGELVDAAIRGRSLLHVPPRRPGFDIHQDPNWVPDDQADGPGYEDPRLARWMRQDRARQLGMRVMVPAGEVRNLVRGA
jgi:hypothetical protein